MNQISTANPKEIALETLKDLSEYIPILIRLSQDASGTLQTNEFIPIFSKLLDGINTLSEAILSVRKVLRIGIMPQVDLLEADLLSILKDILNCQKEGEAIYFKQLLGEHLPNNLDQWKNEGIPALIQKKDT